MTRTEIFSRVQTTLHQQFEIPLTDISLESQLQDDLELDSIDAIDMAVHLQDIVGVRLEEDALKELRTVEDTVDLVEKLIAAQ